MNKWRIVSLAGLLTVYLALILSGCGREATMETERKKPVIEGNVFDSKAWSKSYPQHYQSYLKNNEAVKTDYGGSVRVSKFITEPEIVTLFAGYAFSEEYNEDRGHTYALEDVMKSKRVNAKTPGSCLTCKTPVVPTLMKEMGPAYYTTPLQKIVAEKKVVHPIGCANCHDSKTNELKITRTDFIKAMKKRGIDVNKATTQQMRTFVCAQCHVEYYLKKDSKVVTFPWDNGVQPEQIYEYYQKIQFFDWEHPDSKAKLLKTQHPDYEMFSTGTHGSAGVSCADCHMPYMTVEGRKMSSHWWTSPLKTLDVSCQPCHRQDAQWLTSRVKNTQVRIVEIRTRASRNLVEAHKAIKQALAAPNADQVKIKQAQELVRKGQWAWDWVAAENSTGFHNPVQAMDSLGKAIDYAHQAKAMAEGAY